MNTDIVKGSLAQVALAQGVSLAESFMDAAALIIVDVSGSMAAKDSRGGQSRYDVALEELKSLQARLPGKCAIVAFSDTTLFVPGGVPPLLGAGTNLRGALQFARVADVPDMRFVVISDGMPDDQDGALAEAAKYRAHISTVYVGPETDHEGGRAFLAQLAAKSGGQSVTADRAQELAAKTATLLLGA